MLYKVEITETLQKTIDIVADNDDEAYNIAKRLYHDEVIVLTCDDYVQTDIDIH
jgi:hypothetical protein